MIDTCNGPSSELVSTVPSKAGLRTNTNFIKFPIGHRFKIQLKFHPRPNSVRFSSFSHGWWIQVTQRFTASTHSRPRNQRGSWLLAPYLCSRWTPKEQRAETSEMQLQISTDFWQISPHLTKLFWMVNCLLLTYLPPFLLLKHRLYTVITKLLWEEWYRTLGSVKDPFTGLVQDLSRSLATAWIPVRELVHDPLARFKICAVKRTCTSEKIFVKALPKGFHNLGYAGDPVTFKIGLIVAVKSGHKIHASISWLRSTCASLCRNRTPFERRFTAPCFLVLWSLALAPEGRRWARRDPCFVRNVTGCNRFQPAPKTSEARSNPGFLQ